MTRLLLALWSRLVTWSWSALLLLITACGSGNLSPCQRRCLAEDSQLTDKCAEASEFAGSKVPGSQGEKLSCAAWLGEECEDCG